MAGPTVLLLGTLDTKLEEFLYLHGSICRYDSTISVELLDVGRSPTEHKLVTIPQSDVLANSSCENVDDLPRGEVINTMIEGATKIVRSLHEHGSIHAIISAGGSGNTSLAASVMRNALPIGFPKLIVSTVASGETSMYVGETDLTLMYSVVDVAGLNNVLKGVLDNAAAAIAGMAKNYKASLSEDSITRESRGKPGVGITMFGVTTPAVDTARARLKEAGFEVYVFHATGAGGRAMERLVREGQLVAVLDMTTTELADELMGGVFSAGSDRLTAAAKAGIPQVVSVGALDMVNFGPRRTVEGKFKERQLFEHNPSVTLMRTTEQENAELGKRVAGRLKANCARPDLTKVFLPRRGVSIISVEGQPFHDAQADTALFGAIESGLRGTGIEVRSEDSAINDRAFAELVADRLIDLIHKSKA